MKEMVQRTFLGWCVGRAAGSLLDKLSHLTWLRDKGRMGTVDRLGRCLHPIGHEPLGLRRYTIVLFGNEIPRRNGLPAGRSGLLLQCCTRHRPLSYSHHLRDIRRCVCTERLAILVFGDVQLWAADGARRIVAR